MVIESRVTVSFSLTRQSLAIGTISNCRAATIEQGRRTKRSRGPISVSFLSSNAGLLLTLIWNGLKLTSTLPSAVPPFGMNIIPLRILRAMSLSPNFGGAEISFRAKKRQHSEMNDAKQLGF